MKEKLFSNNKKRTKYKKIRFKINPKTQNEHKDSKWKLRFKNQTLWFKTNPWDSKQNRRFKTKTNIRKEY